MTQSLIKLEQQLITDKCQFLIREHPMGNGFQIIIRFPNNYGASIIRNTLPGLNYFGNTFYGSYTNNDSEVELAIIKFIKDGLDKSFDLCYDTPITDDVLGHLSFEETLKILQKIKELK